MIVFIFQMMIFIFPADQKKGNTSMVYSWNGTLSATHFFSFNELINKFDGLKNALPSVEQKAHPIWWGELLKYDEISNPQLSKTAPTDSRNHPYAKPV